MTQTTPKPLYTREDLRQRLKEHGYPISASYFNKICLPSRNAGPPVAKLWGRRPLYDFDAALAWAESNCTEPASRAA
ncbi:hypothetical protein IVB03_03015 [Bradyrhizobium sp. 168]|uniref:hypothetical protein n=1 Tax=Bradyrhizobium sp. 168 TaxID=2782639 RepID=UPI001FFB3941|nr:hypothetical protein [Bradyrhizobium sp. 168]MCK1578579.1 hypothetical protein [Bradyrhizobium sp. 168]